MDGKRVIFTGVSGTAGRWVVRELLRHGHQILNLDRQILKNDQVHTIVCDVTDSDQVFSALSSHYRLEEPLAAGPPTSPNTVIHSDHMVRVWDVAG